MFLVWVLVVVVVVGLLVAVTLVGWGDGVCGAVGAASPRRWRDVRN